MRINYLFLGFVIYLLGACREDKNTLHKQDYWISFPNETAKPFAECILKYVSEEKFDLKKYQIFKLSQDTAIIRIFGKPKGNFKKHREISEFALQLLANDFSKICFSEKILIVEIGENFKDKTKFLQATSNGKVGFRDYKELAP